MRRTRSTRPARVVATLTVVCSVSITVAPRLLAAPCGLTDLRGEVPEDVALLIRSIGVRDAVLAAALLAAPSAPVVRLLSAARVVADGADAVWFSRLVDDRAQAWKVGGVAAAWALLEAVVGLTPREA